MSEGRKYIYCRSCEKLKKRIKILETIKIAKNENISMCIGCYNKFIYTQEELDKNIVGIYKCNKCNNKVKK